MRWTDHWRHLTNLSWCWPLCPASGTGSAGRTRRQHRNLAPDSDQSQPRTGTAGQWEGRAGRGWGPPCPASPPCCCRWTCPGSPRRAPPWAAPAPPSSGSWHASSGCWGRCTACCSQLPRTCTVSLNDCKIRKNIEFNQPKFKMYFLCNYSKI